MSSINSVTYNVAKYLAMVLKPLVGKTERHIQNSKDFVDKIKGLTLESDETMVSYDVTSLFTCVPTAQVIELVKERFRQDHTFGERTPLSPEEIGSLLELYLNTTYFKYKDEFYRQKHGCVMGSPVSPIVADLYMEEVERKGLDTYSGEVPSH